jgi:hypothetical protein
MRNFMLLFFAVCFVTNGHAQKKAGSPQQDGSLSWLGKWLDAWELVRKDILQLPPDSVPDMLFFDEQYVYTNSLVSAPEATLFKGPGFAGQPVAWRKVAHQGQLTMPDGQQAPVAIMSFAAPLADGKPFFVMSAPSLWEKMGVASYTLKSGDMLTGVFLHEFSHTRQFNGFGVQIDSFEQTDIFKELAIDDDIIQKLFEKDSVYTQQFLPEIQAFYDAAFAKDKTATKRLAVVAMAMLKKRQQIYFVKGNAVLKKPEAVFLSMEGMGQYAAVAWLMHPKGGKLSFEAAVNGFRRKRGSWSQEEGLAMFLVLSKLSKPNWNKVMFGTNPTDIIQLLENALR